MDTRQNIKQNAITFQEYTYDNEWVVVSDFGPAVSDINIETVGNTAIIVAQTNGGETHKQIELPGEESETSSNNGIIQIKGKI